jgi:putative adhesin
MIRMIFRSAPALLVLLIGLNATAAAQDFQKSYQVGAGGHLRVSNVSGDVTVTGYDGAAIVVTGTKKGPDRDMVEVEDLSAGNSVEIKARYPKNCRNCDVSIDFKVQVPRNLNLDLDGISSVSGDVSVTGVTGRVKASAVSGDVHVSEIIGSVNAHSVSGDVEVEITQLDGSEDMKFNSVSGDVNVKLPSSLSAEVDISTLSGSIKSDFPVEVKKERDGPGRSAKATLGSGSRQLKMSSVSGDLHLLHSSR